MPKVYVKGDGQKARAKVAFDLNRLEIKIGRNDDNDLIISDDVSISGLHCVIKRVFGGFIIKDLDSSNGIFKEGRREPKFILEPGMEFHVGDSALVFAYKKDEIIGLDKEEQNPRAYVTEDDLHDLQLAREGKKTSTKEHATAEEKKDTDQPKLKAGPKLNTASKASPKRIAPKRSYIQKANSNPGLALLALVILFVLGTTSGIMIKHIQVHSGSFFDDFKTGKIKTSWD